MPKNEEIVRTRIKSNHCPLCDKDLTNKDATLIDDATYGDVFVCNNHIIQGLDKIVEENHEKENSE